MRCISIALINAHITYAKFILEKNNQNTVDLLFFFECSRIYVWYVTNSDELAKPLSITAIKRTITDPNIPAKKYRNPAIT